MNEHERLPRVYRKADSFVHLDGPAPTVIETALARIARAAPLVASVSDPYRRTILKRACSDLLAPAHELRAFRLRPFIAAEMALLDDDALLRYLFYRYRYDVFPAEHRIDRYPPCVQIEVTSFCNFRCVFCYQQNMEFRRAPGGLVGFMTPVRFKRVIDQLEGNVEAVNLASRGEPLSSPDICEMLAYLPGKFLAAKLNTNAWFLDERRAHAILQSGISTLVFSVDAADDALYRSLRIGGRLDIVERNIRNFADIRRRHYPDLRLITRISGVRVSEAQNMGDISRYWEDAVDQVALVDYCPFENIYAQPENGVDGPCSDLWRRLFVFWNGSIGVCEPDFREVLRAGTIDEPPVSDAWTGTFYQQLRERHLGGQRQSIEPCRRCPVQ